MPSRRAVILGGTGAMGGAIALRLAAAGWCVDVTGRDPAAMPRELETLGVRFHPVDRTDAAAIGRLVGGGADLLVDLLAYRAGDVRALLGVLSAVGCAVVASSRAVYVDGLGRHLNGDEPPRFAVPIGEGAPTLSPATDDVDPFSRAGYGPAKVAVERAALDSGLPVTILRPSKVHGRWARSPRTAWFIERMHAGTASIALADRGESVDHLTAATNVAALVAVVADRPAARVLNCADPDAPTAARLARRVAELVGWQGVLDLRESGRPPLPERHPWTTPYPIVLDTGAAARLGYVPAGDTMALIADEVDWLLHVR